MFSEEVEARVLQGSGGGRGKEREGKIMEICDWNKRSEMDDACDRAVIFPFPLREDKYFFSFSFCIFLRFPIIFHSCRLLIMKVKVEFLGGLDAISSNVRNHKVDVPGNEGEVTIMDLLEAIVSTVITHKEDVLVFLDNGTVRPGILVLINDTDWELEGKEEYVLEAGDVVTFTSTLHGG